MLIIAVVRNSAVVKTGSLDLVHHYMTPHTQERFERDRQPLMPLDEWRARLEAGLPVEMEETLYRPATLEEIRAFEAASATHRGPGL